MNNFQEAHRAGAEYALGLIVSGGKRAAASEALTGAAEGAKAAAGEHYDSLRSAGGQYVGELAAKAQGYLPEFMKKKSSDAAYRAGAAYALEKFAAFKFMPLGKSNNALIGNKWHGGGQVADLQKPINVNGTSVKQLTTQDTRKGGMHEVAWKGHARQTSQSDTLENRDPGKIRKL